MGASGELDLHVWRALQVAATWGRDLPWMVVVVCLAGAPEPNRAKVSRSDEISEKKTNHSVRSTASFSLHDQHQGWAGESRVDRRCRRLCRTPRRAVAILG